MPSTKKHLVRAETHLRVAQHLAGDEDTRSWGAVVLFYAARDLMHGIFDADPGLPATSRHPTNHSSSDPRHPGTNWVIARHYGGRMNTCYKDLYATSTGVRYEGQWVSEQLWFELAEDFQEICAWASIRLSGEGRTPPGWLLNAQL